MKTITELKKGCGYVEYNGQICRSVSLCPTCQALLNQAEEIKKDELKWLNENRHTINGIDVLEVDKRIEQLKKEITGGEE